jgi:multiple sugar transport system permease protein
MAERVDVQRRWLWLMAAPFLLGAAVLVLGPSVAALPLSVFEWDLVRPPSFVGLANFRELLDDRVFRFSLRNTLLYLATAVPIRIAAATGLALLFAPRFRGARAGRLALFLPSVVPAAAYALLWLWLLNPLFGPLNLTLDALGLPTPAWLTEPTPARWAIVIMTSFQIGEAFAIVLAARALVPGELLEQAASCGAPPASAFLRVTLPLLIPALLLVTVRDVAIGLHSTFVPASILTDGGPPPYATTYLATFIHTNAFEYLRYGYASAATVFAVALAASIAWLQYRVVHAWRPAKAVLR